MQGDEVALGEQLVGRDEFHAVKRGGVVGVSEHFHAERTGNDGDGLAYLAEADYAESFAVKLGERDFDSRNICNCSIRRSSPSRCEAPHDLCAQVSAQR